jgi:hypothetical protein
VEGTVSSRAGKTRIWDPSQGNAPARYDHHPANSIINTNHLKPRFDERLAVLSNPQSYSNTDFYKSYDFCLYVEAILVYDPAGRMGFRRQL